MVYRAVVELSYAQGGGPGVNVWHFEAGDPGEVQSAVDALETFYEGTAACWQPGMTVTMPNEVLAGIETGAPEYESVDGWSRLSDNASGGVLAPVLQLVVGWRTAAATRSGRGRTFIGPLGSNMADTQGTPSAFLLSSADTAANSIVVFNALLGGAQIGVWSETTATFRPINAYRIRDTFAVLRSRRD